MNHKPLKLFLCAVSVLFGVVAANAQSCSTVFAGTTFQPKSGITDTNYDIDKVKFEDPSSESLSTGTSFVSTSGGMTQGKYTITKKGMEIASSVSGDQGLFFRYSLNDLITTAGKNTYKVEITFEVAACVTCTKECHRGINFKQVWTDNGGTKDQYKEYQKGSHTWSQTFTATTPKASIAFSEDHSNNGLKMIIKSIKVTGCVDQKIVSENGNKVCAGEPNVLIAKGLNASTYKWEESTDAKATWETLPGTESTITVEVNGETYFRVTAGGTTLTTDKITSVVCCSVAGKREAQLTVDFTSSQLNATNHVNFNQLNDSKSQAITATYTYKASGNVDEDQYAIVNQPSSGGYWKESAITDHTHLKEGRAGTNNDGFLLVNCGKAEKEMFQYTITTGNLCQNTIYDFSAYIANIDSNTDPDHEPVNAGFQVYGMPGNKLLVNAETGDLPYTGEWVEKAESFNSGNYKQFKLIIKNNRVSTSTKPEVIGNDIAVDDIEFSTCTPDVKIYTDDKYKSKDTIVCDDGKTVHLKLEAHAVYDLSTFFKTPYYLFQTSTDKITWKNVKTDASTDTYIEIDVPKDEIYETGLWYRVWVGGDKAAVEQSASSGAPGEGCGKLTAASEPILIQYQCKCSPTDAPTVDDYAQCPVIETSKPIKDLVKSAYDKLRIYDVPEGGTDLGENAVFDPSVVGKFTYYVTNQKNTDPVSHIEYCESPRAAINIEVKSSASISPADVTACFSESTPDASLTFVADNPAFEYSWKGIDDTSIDATGSTYTLDRKEASGKIEVTATDKTGAVCPAKAVVNYNVKEQQKFELTAPSTVCISNPSAEISAKFSAGTGDYKWYKSGTEVGTGSINPGDADATYLDTQVAATQSTVTYKLEIKNDLCSADGSIDVEVADKVNIPLVAKAPVVDNNICLGTTFDIVATYTLSGGESLKWSANDVDIQGVSGVDLTGQSPTENTTYAVVLEGGTCEGDGSLTITVDEPANPEIEVDKEVVCAGTTINITDKDTETAKSYTWKRKSSETGTYSTFEGQTGKDILEYAPDATYIYKKVATNGACVTESNEVKVEVQPEIKFSIDPLSGKICAGQEIELKMSGYPEGSLLKWTEKGSQEPISESATVKVSPMVTTSYTATVTNICEASRDVVVNILPDIDLHITNDTTICDQSNVLLAVTGVGITTVEWTPETDLTKTSDPKVVIAAPKEKTTYTAKVSNGSCGSEAQVTVDITSCSIVPDKFFTPNGDEVNDLWHIHGLENYEGYIVEIFDRYGRRLYIYKKGSFSGGSVKDDFPGWDGIYNGHQMPSTDYWYLITVEEIRKQYNGHFTLKR